MGRKISFEFVLALALIGGAGWLFVEYPPGRVAVSGAIVGAVAASAAVLFGLFLGSIALPKVLKERRIRTSILKKVQAATQAHLTILAQCRMQLVQPDVDGNPKPDRWIDEITYFVLRQVGPSLSPNEQSALGHHFEAVRATIDAIVQAAIHQRPAWLAHSPEPETIGFTPALPANYDRRRWEALLEQDTQLAMIADKLGLLGQKWADEFAASYLATEDKGRLLTLVSKIIADARREYQREQMGRPVQSVAEEEDSAGSRLPTKMVR
jgi:hypothetical protein